MGGHFRPEPYFEGGIVARVRCEEGQIVEDEKKKKVPCTHFIEWVPGEKIFCRPPGSREDGRPYGGCGG